MLFRYNTPSYGTYFAAREFLCQMGEFWAAEYHVDGFRIDDFADVANWDFAQVFRTRTTAAAQQTTPGKSFLVIAEDSRRDFHSTDPKAYNDRPVVDAIWNFGYRDEVRLLLQDRIVTTFGQASRSQRVQHLISKDGVWNNGSARLDPGYADLACAVDYVTSHDVADAPRLMNTLLGAILQAQNLGPGDVPQVRTVLDTAQQQPVQQDSRLNGAVSFAFYRIFGAFAILLTSVGIPMFLAGEEFADVHDLDYLDVNLKQQDPVQWRRASYPGNAALQQQVAQLIALRTTHPALQRNEVQWFYFHPQFDDTGGSRVFGYCRTGATPLGSTGQVIVLANLGAEKFPVYEVPGWPWRGLALTEVGPVATPPRYDATRGVLSLSLDAFQVRVLTT
jgi:1,4-alpha-glucan branching enzyme